jgi:hypothetical protein
MNKCREGRRSCQARLTGPPALMTFVSQYVALVRLPTSVRCLVTSSRSLDAVGQSTR